MSTSLTEKVALGLMTLYCKSSENTQAWANLMKTMILKAASFASPRRTFIRCFILPRNFQMLITQAPMPIDCMIWTQR